MFDETEICARVECVNGAVEVVDGRALRLEEEVERVAGDGRAFVERAVRRKSVVGDGVPERFRRSLREGHGAGEEARRAREVRVVGRGQEGRVADVELT